MPLADIAKKLKQDNKKNKKGPKPGKKGADSKKQGKGNTPKKGTPNKVKGGVGKVQKVAARLARSAFSSAFALMPLLSEPQRSIPQGSIPQGSNPQGWQVAQRPGRVTLQRHCSATVLPQFVFCSRPRLESHPRAASRCRRARVSARWACFHALCLDLFAATEQFAQGGLPSITIHVASGPAGSRVHAPVMGGRQQGGVGDPCAAACARLL